MGVAWELYGRGPKKKIKGQKAVLPNLVTYTCPWLIMLHKNSYCYIACYAWQAMLTITTIFSVHYSYVAPGLKKKKKFSFLSFSYFSATGV